VGSQWPAQHDCVSDEHGFLYETGTFNDAPRIDAKAWADPQFVDAVLKDLGVYPKVDDPGRPIK